MKMIIKGEDFLFVYHVYLNKKKNGALDSGVGTKNQGLFLYNMYLDIYRTIFKKDPDVFGFFKDKEVKEKFQEYIGMQKKIDLGRNHDYIQRRFRGEE